MKQKMMNTFFILVLVGVLALSVLIIKPYASYLVIAILIAYTTKPLYQWLLARTKKKSFSAISMIALILGVLLIPIWFFITEIVIKHGTATISSIREGALDPASKFISDIIGSNFDVIDILNEGILFVENYMIHQSLILIGGIAGIIIGMLIMFFALFYLYRDGDNIFHAILGVIPLKKTHKEVLLGEIHLVTNAVLYGQLITALVQGTIAGIGFAIFGIPNALIWGVVTAIVSFLPVIGTPVIFIPAGILELITGNYVSGIGILVFGFVIIMNIDDILKPLIISEKSRLNPALIIIGVFGGLHVFGLVGFILGPIVLALLITLLKVFKQDFKPSEELSIARKQSEKMVIPLFQEQKTETS